MAILALIVIARSAIFVFWEQSFFDSDQAVIGLMAKHLSELRAFPVFVYGNNYLLGVDAWLAAPVFRVLGSSVATLKLPVLAINIAIAWLLVWILERETRLRPALGAVAAAFFVLAPPATAAHLTAAMGGNVEPFLYVLLLWLVRRRPGWFGTILGIGFFNREFTLYGLVALAAVAAVQRTLFRRETLRAALAGLWSFIWVWIAIEIAKRLSSAAGPGFGIAFVQQPGNVTGVLGRFCFDLQTIPAGIRALVAGHWPQLFGTAPQPLLPLGVDSRVSQGAPGVWIAIAAATLIAMLAIAELLVHERRLREEHEFCAYITTVGLLSAAVFAFGRCGGVAPFRYDLLSVLAAVGVSAWFLAAQPRRSWRAAWLALVAAWAAVSVTAHTRLWTEYLTDPPYGVKRQIIRRLDARGIQYASSDYWIAYYITFLTNERIIVMADDVSRILSYEPIVDAHRAESVRIARSPCAGGTEELHGVFFCPR